MAKISKGMPIEIGIKRLSLLKEKGINNRRNIF